MRLFIAAFVWLGLAATAAANPAYTFHPTACPQGSTAAVMTVEGKLVGGCMTSDQGPPPTPVAAFVMAPGGLDANAGTTDAPVATREACRALMRAPGAAYKTCMIRSGDYVVSQTLVLDQNDAGETWTAYTGEAPHFIERAGYLSDWKLKTGADGITISGLSASGFQALAGGACNSNNWLEVSSSDRIANLTISNNRIDNFGCAFSIFYVTNPVFTGNQISNIGYVGISCNACTGKSDGSSVISGNTLWNFGLDPNNTNYGNAYPLSFSQGSSPPYISNNITASGNIAVNNKLWQCYDAHGGDTIVWKNNLCIGAGGNTAMNNAGMDATHPIKNVTVTGNILDKGSLANGRFDIVMCAVGDCSSNNPLVVGGTISNNYQLGGVNASCQIAANPTVTVNNPSNPYCKNDPETVTGISIKGGMVTTVDASPTPVQSTSGSFTANQPGAVVATLAVTMSANIWAFPTPPGQLSISGANSGGFQICGGNKICQPPAGTPAGMYNDFAVTAAMSGMRGSPYTQAAGSLQLVGQ